MTIEDETKVPRADSVVLSEQFSELLLETDEQKFRFGRV